MDIFNGLLENLFYTFVGMFVIREAQIFKKKYQVKIAKYFWKPFIAGEQCLIIMGRIEKFNNYERSGLIGFGDAVALAELKSYFDSRGKKSLAVNYDDKNIDGDYLNSNLILLGGPSTNIITKDVFDKISSTLRFEGKSIAITDTEEKEKYAPSVDVSKKSGTDYGLIIRTTSPYNKSKKVVILAGSWGYGTWAGVRHSISKDFDKEIADHGDPDSFECLVRSDIVLNTPKKIDTVILRRLS